MTRSWTTTVGSRTFCFSESSSAARWDSANKNTKATRAATNSFGIDQEVSPLDWGSTALSCSVGPSSFSREDRSSCSNSSIACSTKISGIKSSRPTFWTSSIVLRLASCTRCCSAACLKASARSMMSGMSALFTSPRSFKFRDVDIHTPWSLLLGTWRVPKQLRYRGFLLQHPIS